MRFAVFLAIMLPLAAQEPLLRIPPAHATVEIDGRPIAIALSGEVRGAGRPDSYTVSLAVDLSDLQAHAAEILRAHIDRSEECGERIHILQAELVPAPAIAVLTAQMHFERWACAKALGKTVRKRLVAGDGIVKVTLTPVLENPTRARLEATVREIQADGSLGELLRSGSLGASLKEKIRTSVQSALDKATDFRATLPPVLQDLVRLRSVSFADAGAGRLFLALDAEALISGPQLQQLRQSVSRHP